MKSISEKYIICFVIGMLLGVSITLLFNKQEIITVEKPVIKYQTKTEIKTDTIYKEIIKPKYLTETIIQ